MREYAPLTHPGRRATVSLAPPWGRYASGVSTNPMLTRRSLKIGGTAAATLCALFVFATVSADAAPLLTSPAPNIPCCGNKDATLTASAIDEGHYAYISASSSGWISGSNVYLWYYVVDPHGGQSATYPLGSCRPSGGTCNAATTYYAGYCVWTGTYHVYVWGTIYPGSQV